MYFVPSFITCNKSIKFALSGDHRTGNRKIILTHPNSKEKQSNKFNNKTRKAISIHRTRVAGIRALLHSTLRMQQTNSFCTINPYWWCIYFVIPLNKSSWHLYPFCDVMFMCITVNGGGNWFTPRCNLSATFIRLLGVPITQGSEVPNIWATHPWLADIFLKKNYYELGVSRFC